MDKEIIRTKQSFTWNAFLMFLNSFYNVEIMQDEGFAKLYKQIYEYVTSKIPLENKGDILDIYVVIEQIKD